MKSKLLFVVFVLLFNGAFAQYSDSVKLNFDSPESALTSLENCKLRKDLTNALLCKDFVAETTLFMELQEIRTKDSIYIKTVQEDLKKQFIEDFNKYRPNTSGIRARHFPEKESINPSLVLLREVIIFKNQVIISQSYYIGKNVDGKWKVLSSK